MAEAAERKAGARMSAVASCAATECAHNEDRDCTAGEIRVAMKDGKAVCDTYTSEKPKARP